jgi:phosphatidylglycerophosphate synthase
MEENIFMYSKKIKIYKEEKMKWNENFKKHVFAVFCTLFGLLFLVPINLAVHNSLFGWIIFSILIILLYLYNMANYNVYRRNKE